MQLLGRILLTCLVIAAAQAALSVAITLIIVMLILGLFVQPKETLSFLVIGAAISLLQLYPLATIGVGGSLLVLVFIVGRHKSPPPDAPDSDEETLSLPPPKGDI